MTYRVLSLFAGIGGFDLGLVGIERDETYFTEACRRIAETAGKDLGPLFSDAEAA